MTNFSPKSKQLSLEWRRRRIRGSVGVSYSSYSILLLRPLITLTSFLRCQKKKMMMSHFKDMWWWWWPEQGSGEWQTEIDLVGGRGLLDILQTLPFYYYFPIFSVNNLSEVFTCCQTRLVESLTWKKFYKIVLLLLEWIAMDRANPGLVFVYFLNLDNYMWFSFMDNILLSSDKTYNMNDICTRYLQSLNKINLWKVCLYDSLLV